MVKKPRCSVLDDVIKSRGKLKVNKSHQNSDTTGIRTPPVEDSLGYYLRCITMLLFHGLRIIIYFSYECLENKIASFKLFVLLVIRPSTFLVVAYFKANNAFLLLLFIFYFKR